MKARYLFLAFWLLILLILPPSNGHAYQGGETGWSKPVDIAEGVTRNTHAFGVSACDPYQNLHIFWGDYAEGGGAIYYRNDIGGSLSTPADVLLTGTPNIFQLQAVISEDRVYIAWTSALVNSDLYFASADLASASDPRAWTKPQFLASNSNNPALALDADSRIHIIYAEAKDNDALFFSVNHIVSRDQGDSWSDPDIVLEKSFLAPAYINSALSIDGRGRLHVGLTLRSQEYGLFSELGYMRSVDGGSTWSRYKLVDDTSTTFQGVALIAPYAFGEDEIHLTWHDVRRMHMWSTDGGETWSYPEEIMPLGGAFGGFNQIVQDSRGNLHVILAVLDGVYSVEWERGKWKQPEQIDNRAVDPHGQQITVCQGNRLHVVYYDRTGGETVWYSTREVNSPHKQPLPIPTQPAPEVIPTTPASAGSGVEPATPNPLLQANPDEEAVPTAQPFAQILAGLVPLSILILGIFLYQLKKSK
jgi:hypothetical protein